MFKKSLLVGAVAMAVSSVALADGFYVGAGLGGEGFHDETTLNTNGNTDVGNLGVTGGLLGGYTFNFANQFNLGLEAFGNLTNAKALYSNTTPNYTVKARYNFGARFVPAYQLTPDTDLHALLGYVRGNFKVSTTSSANTFNANGFQVGAGSSTNVAKDVAVRGDIVYSGYQDKTTTDTSSNTIKNRINTLDGIISVNYKFG